MTPMRTPGRVTRTSSDSIRSASPSSITVKESANVDADVSQRELLGTPLLKADLIGKTGLPCQRLCFAEQIGADVDIDDAIGASSAAGDLAENDTRPA